MKALIQLFLFIIIFSCVDEKVKDIVGKEKISSIETNKQVDNLNKAIVEESTSSIQLEVEEMILGSPPIDTNFIHVSNKKVIARNGLFLRKSPNKTGEVITKIPYFEEIEILSSRSFNNDTITVDDNSVKNKYLSKVVGAWVKVKYKNQEGFVHSAYISPKSDREKKILSEDHDFTFAWGNCNINFHPKPELKWFGVYKDGNVFKRKAINLEWYFNYANNMNPVVYSAPNSDSLLFCFATKSKLSDKVINGTTKYNFGFSSENYKETLSDIGISFQPIKNEEGSIYTLSRDNLRQVLNPPSLEIEVDGITKINWIGDLDEDGQDDYIISYGAKWGRAILYLSSESSKDEIVKPVAIYLISYCC